MVVDGHFGQSYGKANTLTMPHWHNLTVLLVTGYKKSFGPPRDWGRQSAHKGSPGPGKPLLRC